MSVGLCTKVEGRGEGADESSGAPSPDEGPPPTVALVEWHVSLRDQLFLRGMRSKAQLLNAVSITSNTTRALRLKRSTRKPYPELAPGPQAPCEATATALAEAESRLRFYHAGKGDGMHMSRLLCNAAPDPDLFPLDDPAFEHLLLWQRTGLWHQDRGVLKHRLLALPKDVLYSVPELQYSLSRHGCDTTTGDDLPFSVMACLGHDGLCALCVYLWCLSVYLDAMSNQAQQLGIDKGKGPPWLFLSYRPIKIGSCSNRLVAAS